MIFCRVKYKLTKRELEINLSMIKFLPFLGDRILDGFYSTLENIN